MQDAANTSSIYFIQSGSDGPIKIGYASNVPHRLAGLQTGSHEKMTLLGTSLGGREEEKFLHDMLDAYRINGEWFGNHEMVRAVMAAFLRRTEPLIRLASISEGKSEIVHRKIDSVVGQLSEEAKDILRTKGSKWSSAAHESLPLDVGMELYWLGLTITYWSPLAIEVAKHLKGN